MVNGKAVKVVRKRETLTQLLANEQACLD